MIIHAENKNFGTPSDKDLRYFPRWEVSNRVVLQRENDALTHECLSKDINSSGACVRTNENVLPNTKLNLTIYLAENIEPIEVYGRVLWQKMFDGESQLGIKFERISDKASNLIFQYAFEYKKEDLIKQWFRGF